jgi:thiamine biosynthesis lipoprotein
MGAEGITWAADRPDCEILIVDDSRRVHRTAGLALAS